MACNLPEKSEATRAYVRRKNDPVMASTAPVGRYRSRAGIRAPGRSTFLVNVTGRGTRSAALDHGREKGGKPVPNLDANPTAGRPAVRRGSIVRRGMA
jgi:hypothetical protein